MTNIEASVIVPVIIGWRIAFQLIALILTILLGRCANWRLWSILLDHIDLLTTYLVAKPAVSRQ